MKRITALLLLLVAGAALGQTYDHVVVTTDSFVPQILPLCEWLETSAGMRDTVVLVEDVCVSFQGRDEQERLRNFIRYAYQSWSTTHVLLGGDVEIVPCRRCFVDARVHHPLLYDSIPCDLYYADLDGDWDLDGDNLFGEPEDSCDLYPDLFVSRLPATTIGAVDLLVGKLLIYLGNPEAEYLDQVLLAGFDVEIGIHGEVTMEMYDSLYVPASMKPCNEEYESEPGRHIYDAIDYLNQGQHFWAHIDHCNYFGMGMGYTKHGDVLYREQLYALTNNGEYSVMTSLGCCTGEFDTSDCASEVFMLAPNGGGIAVASNSRYGLGSGGNPQRGMSYALVEGFIKGTFSDPDTGSVGAGLLTAWADAAPLADTSRPYRWCLFCWNLLGESAMPVWIPLLSGAEERAGRRLSLAELRVPTVLRGPELARMDVRVLDIQGRDVSKRRASLSAGVYYVLLPASRDGRAASPGRKVIIAD